MPQDTSWSLVSLRRQMMVAVVLAAAFAALLQAQVPGRNVNMVSGRTLPTGDPFLQRQNEPSIAASTRNPLHLLAGANDYRTVDLPGLPNSNETGDAWMGVFKSYDGGNTWRSTLIPGYPQDPANQIPNNPNASPLRHYAAAADPVVRAGTNGLFYYSGIVFNRDTVDGNGATVKGRSAMFVSRFIDNNNQEAGDPIVFTGTTMIEESPGGIGAYFIDKPWFAVDRPRTNPLTCTVNTSQKSPTANDPNHVITTSQSIAGGAAYAVYSRIVGEGAETRSQIYFRRSVDCGVTWSDPLQISSTADPINQGATLAIDPMTGAVYIAWRRFTSDGTDDSIMVTRSIDQGRKWDPPGRARRFPRGRKVGLVPEIHGQKFKQATELAPLASLDQPTESYQFRTNAYPTMTIDGAGRVYVAWSERGFAPLNQDADDGDARILITSSTDGSTWSQPTLVANDAVVGHQVMPTLTFAGGKLMIAYYDFREDASGIFMQFVDERWAVVKRHTVDVRAAMASPGATPTFGASVRVSEYLMGSRPGTGPRPVEQLQFNPPNLKLFKLGTVPFFGDYIDLTPSPAFVPTPGGGWTNNTAPSSAPLFHVVWTDNRDVIPPANGDWTTYTPPGSTGGPSSYDPTKTVSMCMPGHEGMRNQNIYTARITGGLVAGSPGNTKPLSTTFPRSFVVFAQNATETTRTYRFTIENQPVGGRASFLQDSVLPATNTFTPPAVVTTLDVQVPRRSTVARSVFATSSDSDAQINVSIKEIAGVGGAEVTNGAQSVVVLNPDISNPDISNPDISNPDISNPDISNPDISNAEVSNPDISNPDISNPDISNPDISNPDISNPDISNVQVANPDISNPDISNPDISNPDISNPDISNPDISNPDISNQSLTDTSWTVTNNGNTAASYSVKLLLNGDAPIQTEHVVQLVLHKVYRTPVSVNCALGLHTQNVLLANITNPTFITGDDPLANPDISNPDISNATLWLAPGETAKITVRVLDVDVHDDVTFDASAALSPVVVAQAKDVAVAVGGGIVVGSDEPIALPPGLNVQFSNVPTAVATGSPIGTIRVRVIDSAGAPLPGALVHLSVHANPSNVQSGATISALTDVTGIATFNVPSQVAGTYKLRAQAQFATLMDAVVYSHEIVVFAPTVPGVSGSLTYNNGPEAGVWTQNVAQTFELTIDLTAKKSSLKVNGVAVAGAQNLNFVDTNANNLSGISMEIGSPGAMQIVAWDGIQIRNAAGNVVILNGNFDVDTVNLAPSADPAGAPIGDQFAMASTNPGSTILVRAASGDLVSKPVELAQAEGPGSLSLAGIVAGTPPTSGVWVVSWKSLMRATGAAQVSANIVIRDSSTRPIASVNYRSAVAITVTNAGDSGSGSLRQAILEANANGSSQDVIRFNIPGAGPHTIALQSLLPTIEHPVTIDGTTQPLYAGSPRVFISGALIPVIGTNNIGLRVQGANSEIRGLGIIRFQGPGIYLGGAGSRVRGNFIGVDATGAAAGNLRGVEIHGVNQRIGGTTVADRNVISANPFAGIYVTSDGGSAIIEGNFIGTDPTGVLARGNGAGVLSDDSGGTLVGGTTAGAGNVISGNSTGILLTSTNSGIQIHGNFIGTDVTGTLDLGNTGNGIQLNGNASGTQIGAAGAPNVISGNNSNGIQINDSASNTSVRFNLIGTNVAGTAAIPNGSPNEFLDIVGAGVEVNGHDNQIGGPGAGNLISGNGTGVSLGGLSTANTVRGNVIGTNAATTLAIGNRFGIFNSNADTNTIGGVNANEGNLVAGNKVEGIAVTGEGSHTILIQGNYVGVTPGGTAIANQFDGIRIGFGASQVTVGGGPTGGANFIAFNGSSGINVDAISNAAILRNSVHSNGGLGIDKAGGGVTLNDTPDANGVQNFPVLTFAQLITEGVHVVGSLNSTPGATFQVTFFLSSSCDTSGHGEGQIPFGSIDALATDATGFAAIDFSATTADAAAGQSVTAIARNLATNNTSEFSACATLNPDITNPDITNPDITNPDITTVVGPVGGSGGSAFGPLACPVGQIGVGFLGRAGDDIDRTELICAPASNLSGTRTSAGAVGTLGGADYGSALSCASGFYMTGIHGRAGNAGPGNIVDTLGVFCAHPEGGVTSLGPVGAAFAGTSAFNLSCPAGKRIVGIQGRAGLVLDQISLLCQ